MVHIASQVDRSARAGAARMEPVGHGKGEFRGIAVEAGRPQARASSALRTAWLDFKHGVKSLLGLRVSTTKPAQISDAVSATRGVLHAMTKRNVDALDVAEALSSLMEHANLPRDEARSGLSQGAAALFRPALRDLSDLQLKRLHSTIQRRPELMEGLAQIGTGVAMMGEEPTHEDLIGAGAVDDLGFLNMALRDGLMAEARERGFDFPAFGPSGGASDRGLELLAKHAVANRGDLRGAVAAARTDRAEEHAAQLARVLDELGLGDPSPAREPAAAVGIAPRSPAAAPPDNSAVNAPFGQARIDWIVREKTACMTPPADPEKDAQKMLPVDVAGGFEVAWIFRRDLAGSPDIAIDGAPVFTGDLPDANARAERFCAALSEKGLGKDDILTVSRMINQNTFAVVGSQYMVDPEGAPGIKLADGDEIPVIPSFGGLKWSVTRTDGGVEIGVTASADLAAAPMATRGGQIATFDAGSRASVAMTFVLDRDDGGVLRLATMRDSRMDVRAASGGVDLV